MPSRATLMFGASALMLGIAIGLVWEPNAAHNAVQAQTGANSRAASPAAGILDASRHLQALARKTTPSVVHIISERRTDDRRIISRGSGFIVSSSSASGAFVATNWHVIEGFAIGQIEIHLYDGRVVRPQRIWSDSASDLAVMKIDGRNLVTLHWADSDRVEIGQMVYAMGSPFGLSRSLTFGVISGKGRRSLQGRSGRRLLNQDFLQTDAAINPGNSGGPLLDLHGRVVAINQSIATSSGASDGVGFSIPSNLARNIIEQLLRYDKVRRAYLGVRLDSDFDIAQARRLGLDRVRGARIIQVNPSTPASRGGLRVNDVILSFNDIEVDDENHLINLVSLTPIGRKAQLAVIRGGRKLTVEVLLGDREALLDNQ